VSGDLRALRQNARLDALEARVAAILAYLGLGDPVPATPPGVSARAVELARAGRTMHAIKAQMQDTGAGFRTATEAVAAIEQRRSQGPGSGCCPDVRSACREHDPLMRPTAITDVSRAQAFMYEPASPPTIPATQTIAQYRRARGARKRSRARPAVVGAALALALLSLGAWATPALAADCSYSAATHVVSITHGGDFAELDAGGGAIRLDGTPCGAATTTNTASIDVADQGGPGGHPHLVLDLAPGPFAPGFGDEPGDADEIELHVSFPGFSGTVDVRGGVGDERWRVAKGLAGAPRLNLNASEPVQDVDVSIDGEPGLYLDGGDGDDTLAPGPIGILGAFDGPLYLAGGPGNDTLGGGLADDELLPGAGDDAVTGGGGSDRVSYVDAAAAVRVDLGAVGPQATLGSGADSLTGIERTVGSGHDDTLIGDDGANTLFGAAGDDRLIGRGGDDLLLGGNGHDTASYELPPAGVSSGVTATLGAGQQDTGGAGIDKLNTDLENLTGSPFADALAGDGGANVLDGRGGTDLVSGHGGADELRIRDGLKDDADCGDGVDAVVADVPGLDAISPTCEAVELAVAPPPPTPGIPAPAPVTAPATPAEPRPPVLSALTARVARHRRLVLRYRSDSAATAEIVIQRRVPAPRRWKRVLARTRPVRAGSNTLRLRLPRRARRPGRYRVTLRARGAGGLRSDALRARFRVPPR
jgi:Ca2+-binding RTX toxin-like protein